MKVLTFGIVLLLLVGSLFAYRHYGNHRDSMVSNTITEKAPAPDWVPTDAELGNRNQGVGWVFGRMIGAADAPGSPNHSPFGANLPGRTPQGIGP
ncbi:MAG: hypothetical protein O3C40_18180 [Planctomycetota bacterium]|nr:hypothetical protein [Planctomycetota bacterium]